MYAACNFQNKIFLRKEQKSVVWLVSFISVGRGGGGGGGGGAGEVEGENNNKCNFNLI